MLLPFSLLPLDAIYRKGFKRENAFPFASLLPSTIFISHINYIYVYMLIRVIIFFYAIVIIYLYIYIIYIYNYIYIYKKYIER
jgi:hypothetical protein